MKSFIKFIKAIFSKNTTIDLFPNQNKPVLAELGGNYCEDLC